MDASRKVQKSRRREDRPTQSRRTRSTSKPSSSHPEADPALARSLVTESDEMDYKQCGTSQPAIVSINGEDVYEERPKRRRAA